MGVFLWLRFEKKNFRQIIFSYVWFDLNVFGENYIWKYYSKKNFLLNKTVIKIDIVT